MGPTRTLGSSWGTILGMCLCAAPVCVAVVRAGQPAPGAPPKATPTPFEADAKRVAQMLGNADVWLLPQPKSVALTDSSFDLTECRGFRFVGLAQQAKGVTNRFLPLLKDRSGVSIGAAPDQNGRGCIVFGLFSNAAPSKNLAAVSAADLAGLGDQGYVLHIDSDGVTAAATGEAGLYYAARTLAQIASDRTVLPGLRIRDWPSLTYRGALYDISRGQVPTQATLKRLADVLAEAKSNMFELYLEDVFKWKRHADIAPPEAMTPEEARELSAHAAGHYMEVHPLLQVFGHLEKIGAKPAYRHLMVPVPQGGIGDRPWTTTLDIRKPEAVAFMIDLLEEICQAFPAKFLNVDITEIADYGFTQSGTTREQLNELVFQYLLKLRETVRKHRIQLMVAQGALGVTGHLNGIAPIIRRLPKDIVIGSYYTAEFYGGWDKDYPLLRQLGIDFFAQPWIDSHGHIMPYVGHAMAFSDMTVGRSASHGAIGSVTTDWGDMGHYHLGGSTWYPFLYHGACAWTGAKLDRDYFDQAFCRLLYGIKDDSVAQAIKLAGNINGQKMKIRNAAGAAVDLPAYVGNATIGRYYWEFFNDPFKDPWVTQIVDPSQKGLEILKPADQAASLLQVALQHAKRNQENIRQLLFAAKNYQAMGRKLVVRAHALDPQYPRQKLATEWGELAKTYESLKAEFQQLWLAENRPSDGFHELVARFDRTISPCKKTADELSRR